MAPQLRALAALSENPGSIPSSHLSVAPVPGLVMPPQRDIHAVKTPMSIKISHIFKNFNVVAWWHMPRVSALRADTGKSL